jgi:hypothetical protein
MMRVVQAGAHLVVAHEESVRKLIIIIIILPIISKFTVLYNVEMLTLL